MTSPFSSYPAPERPFIQANPAAASQPRSSTPGAKTGGAKRGRKPKATGSFSATNSPRPPAQSPLPGSGQGNELQWNNTASNAYAGSSTAGTSTTERQSPGQSQAAAATESGVTLSLPGADTTTASTDTTVPRPPGTAAPGEEDGEGEDDHEMLPAMADDDYSAQLSFQSQSKDNLKCVCRVHDHHTYD